MGLEQFREHFAESRYSVDLGYYPEHDVYIVNHRSLWAKIVGAPVIIATVHHFRFLPNHYERYKRGKDRKEQFERTLDSYHLRWEDRELYFGDASIGRFDPGYHNRSNYQDDSRAEQIIRSFDAMETNIHRIGRIHRAMGRIPNQRIRDGLLDLLSAFTGSPLHGDSAWSMLKNMYQAGWPGVK